MEEIRGAKLANPEHVEILKQGVKVWNEWRKENPDIEPDLMGSIINGRHEPEIIGYSGPLIRVSGLLDLVNIDLNRADLNGSSWVNVNLTNANFSEAILYDATFLHCILDSASMFKSLIYFIAIQNCRIFKTDFSMCKGGKCFFADVDLSKAIGLDKIEHDWPSTIGIDTIFLSKGQVPESFLRGCGVPDNFIKLIPSLTAQAIQYYSCFISYSSQDDDFARRLHNDLQGIGVRCWFAPEDMKIGDRIRPTIDQSIRLHDKLLLILSEQSIASQWVEKEVETAFEKERRNPGKTVLFPIRVDDAVMDSDEAWAADIRRTRHIGDFSNWKDHDSYQKAFDRLMRDLKASEE